jgi:hypothetical protein
MSYTYCKHTFLSSHSFNHCFWPGDQLSCLSYVFFLDLCHSNFSYWLPLFPVPSQPLDSMHHRSSWQATSYSANEEISHLLCNVKVYCCIYMRPSLVHILNQMNRVWSLPISLSTFHIIKFMYVLNLLILGLFNSALCVSDYVVLNGRMISE